MKRHAPDGYACPFCRNIELGDGDHPVEILHRYEDVIVKMNPMWRPTNPGAALVFPIEHVENVYELPDELGLSLQRAVRETALAMKAAFSCDGVSTRQHNEPAGGQDIWHFHVHVIPRFDGDLLDSSETSAADPEELRRLSDLLRAKWTS